MPDQTNQIDLFGILSGLLRPWIEQEQHGLFSIAPDPFAVIELLAEAPGKFRTILCWQGEEPMGDHRSGIVKHTFRVTVSHNRGLPFLRGASLSAPLPGTRPLMEIASTVRDFLRTLTIADERTSHLLEYAGCTPVTVDAEGKTYQLDAYELTFKVIAALPKIVRN